MVAEQGAISASDLRAASGLGADEQDPEANGKAENEGERLEMEQIEREAGEAKAANEEPGMLQAIALKWQDSMGTVSFQDVESTIASLSVT